VLLGIYVLYEIALFRMISSEL